MCLCFLSTTSSEFRSKIRGTNRGWEGQLRGGKKQRRLSWLKAETCSMHPCTHHLLCRHACTVRSCWSIQVVLSCSRRTGIMQPRGAFLSMLTLRRYQKCMLSNTGLVSSLRSRRTRPENWYRAILHGGCIHYCRKKKKSQKCKNSARTFARCRRYHGAQAATP